MDHRALSEEQEVEDVMVIEYVFESSRALVVRGSASPQQADERTLHLRQTRCETFAKGQEKRLQVVDET